MTLQRASHFARSTDFAQMEAGLACTGSSQILDMIWQLARRSWHALAMVHF